MLSRLACLDACQIQERDAAILGRGLMIHSIIKETVMKTLTLLLILILSGFSMSFAQDTEEMEPAFSETEEFRKFLREQLLPWTLDDEIQATNELIAWYQSGSGDLGFITKRLQDRVDLLMLAKGGNERAKQTLHDEFGQLYEDFGVIFGSAKLLGLTEQAYFDHLKHIHNRFKLFDSLVD